MKMSDTGEKSNLRIKVKEEVMEEVDYGELNYKSMEVSKCAGVLKSVWKRHVFRNSCTYSFVWQ